MTRRPEKTAAATRRARQGGGGFLGMEEMAKLLDKPACTSCAGRGLVPNRALICGTKVCFDCRGTGVQP
jgi:hypothetical protein